ncbi:MAG: hypothetical protein IJ635_03425 [Bacteroidaceae bacterium]|nr:hypothetical protein [Bacteroidaceae bacterium]
MTSLFPFDDAKVRGFQILTKRKLEILKKKRCFIDLNQDLCANTRQKAPKTVCAHSFFGRGKKDVFEHILPCSVFLHIIYNINIPFGALNGGLERKITALNKDFSRKGLGVWDKKGIFAFTSSLKLK